MDADELLIESALKGNQDAFRKIVEKYQALVFAICINIAGDRQEAENLAQETFLQVYRSLAQYQSKGFKTWVGRIATNKAIDWKRKTKAESMHRLVSLDDMADLLTREEDSLQEQIIKKEAREKLLFLCNRLPEKYGIILRKHYLHAKSYRQISVEEGISEKTVEARLYRARKFIREQWEEE